MIRLNKYRKPVKNNLVNISATVRRDQIEYIKKENINFSKLLRDLIDSIIKKENKPE